jgi:hypothetical protein
VKKLADMNVVKRTAAAGKMVRPELVNLIPQHQNQQSQLDQQMADISPAHDEPPAGRRPSRRNIVLR